MRVRIETANGKIAVLDPLGDTLLFGTGGMERGSKYRVHGTARGAKVYYSESYSLWAGEGTELHVIDEATMRGIILSQRNFCPEEEKTIEKYLPGIWKEFYAETL